MTESAQPTLSLTKRLTVWAVLLVVTLLAYTSSYRVPFIFDDIHSIVENPSIRHWQSLGQTLSAPDQSSFAGRPVVNLSFALQAGDDGQMNLTSLHAVNNIIHAVNAILFFELLIFILSIRGLGHLNPWAMVAAAIWVVHPLVTEAVVYLTQRTELLVSLFYLLTCYASLRYMVKANVGWLVIAIFSSVLGMGCKENMVSVPVMVLLLNAVLRCRTIKSNWPLHAGLACTWLVLWLLNHNGPRSASAGLGLDVTPWQYLLTQSTVIPFYLWQTLTGLRLSIVHHWPMLEQVHQTLPWSLLPIALLAMTVWGLCKRRTWALAGAAFFLILGPTSSVIPILTETVAERRMYLPAAMVICVLLLGLGQLMRHLKFKRWPVWVTGLLLSCLCLWATHQRLADYKSPTALWQSALTYYPDDARIRNGLAYALIQNQQFDQAREHLQQAIASDPNAAEAYGNLGLCYLHAGQRDEALATLKQATSIDPTLAKPYNNLGIVLAQMNRLDEATTAFTQAITLQNHFPQARLNMGMTLIKRKLYPAAHEQLQRALPGLEGDDRDTCLMQLAMTHLGMGQPDLATAQLNRLLKHNPNHQRAQALLKRLQQMGAGTGQ